MGKKAKKRARSVQKVKHGPSTSPGTESQTFTNVFEASEGGVAVNKDRQLCSRVDEGINFDTLNTKLGTSGASCKCEDCRGDHVERPGKKGKGKQKVSRSESKAIWVCLTCGHFSCGGAGLPTTQQSHSVWHAKKNRHPLVVHYKNHQLVWCYTCNKLVSAEISEDNKLKEALCEVVKKLREQPDQGSRVDVEDFWFGSGSVTSAIKSEYSAGNGEPGYSIRGLVNLGNTCFFNSIMQNLLAVKRLRDLLLTSGGSAGPLSAAMRKLFLETSSESDSRTAINPRSVFGSLCTKAPQFRGYQQHDSHELLRCLLDVLSSEELSSQLIDGCSRDSKTGPSLVDSIFGGQLSSTVCCLECGHSSTIFEPFLDLSLPVPIKNSANKRVQHTGRGKKPKLPPKRSVRNQSKTGKVSVVKEKLSNRLTNGSSISEMQPLVEPGTQLVLFQGEESALSNTVDANGMAFDMHSSHEDRSDTQITQKQQTVENVSEQSATSDCLTWLDYLEPDPVSNDAYVTLETDKIKPINGIENDDTLNDVTCPTALDSCTESDLVSALAATSLDDPEKFDDDLEPVVSAQIQNHVPEFEEKANASAEVDEDTPESHSPNEIAEHNAEVSCNSGLSNQLCAVDSYTSQRGDEEGHSKTHDPEITPPPMEDIEIQASSSVVGEEQDYMDFSGFGNLFDEPDVNLNLKPSDDRVIAKRGLNGNNSDSEPNEVDDDKDAPVSVESCFASFTKPELLSKDEHGWQCDNCSKILQKRKIAMKKRHQMHGTETLPSRCKDPTPNGAIDIVRAGHNMETIDKNVEEDDFDCGSVPLNEDIHDNGSCMLFEIANQSQDSSECDCNIDGSATEAILPPHEGESTAETEQEEVNVEDLKVKRDATKSILINKAPPILTIHLKRFSQEARGRLSKLNGHVKFKEMMDLKPYMDSRSVNGETVKYRLIGLVEHLGNMRGGHYVAYVRGGDIKSGYGDCWYHASDAYVREASLDEVLQCQAYILFYERT